MKFACIGNYYRSQNANRSSHNGREAIAIKVPHEVRAMQGSVQGLSWLKQSLANS